jgi:hypothetical protein
VKFLQLLNGGIFQDFKSSGSKYSTATYDYARDFSEASAEQ